MKRWYMFAVSVALLVGIGTISTREIHVAKTGSDSGVGDQIKPYLTINKAAQAAQQGSKLAEKGRMRLAP